MQGDSGGPLICGNSKSKNSHSLVGVLQGGPFKIGNSSNYWSIYSHAPAYIHWMEIQAINMRIESSNDIRNANVGQQQSYISVSLIAVGAVFVNAIL
jgi:secreted trypsin-like serine protease